GGEAACAPRGHPLRLRAPRRRDRRVSLVLLLGRGRGRPILRRALLALALSAACTLVVDHELSKHLTTPPDAGNDAGDDAGDAGTDAGPDGGEDAGPDAGEDAGPDA